MIDYWSVGCPTCGADVNKPCIWDGIAQLGCHTARIEAAAMGTQDIPKAMIDRAAEEGNLL